MTNQPRWQQLLAERGILEQALNAGWKPNGSGWLYPLFSNAGEQFESVTRWKAFDSSVKPKYLWPEGKPEWANYYLLPGTYEAITANAGRLILASGEPDVLAFRSAGANNVLSWFGERAIPETLVDDLLAIGVSALLLYPDLDEAGYIWAQNIVTAFQNTSIAIEVCQLPGQADSAFDINKLWIACEFDSDKFWDALAYAPIMDIHPLPLKAPLPPLLSLPSLNTRQDLPAAYYDAIERALGVTEYRRDGWSKPIRCPFKDHEKDDRSPAAAWHSEKHILSCLKGCGTEILAVQVGKALNLNWRDYLPAIKPKSGNQAASDTPRVDLRSHIYSWQDATNAVVRELTSDVPASAEPLPIRWRSIARFGGFAQLITPGKLMAVVGDSGDGKTSFIECQTDYWRMNGFDGFMWGPEWSYLEYVYRAIQRMGGPSFMEIVLHKKWQLEAQRNVPEEKRHGMPLNSDKLQLAISKADEINKWPGKLFFIQKAGISVEQIASVAADVISEQASKGGRIAWAAFDYAQLLDTNAPGENERLKRSINQIECLSADHNLVTLVGSQITKQDGRAALGGTKNDKHAMQYLRSDAFKLVIAISREEDDQGKKLSEANIRISKNSLGACGDTKLTLNTLRLTWHDLTTTPVPSYISGERDNDDD